MEMGGWAVWVAQLESNGGIVWGLLTVSSHDHAIMCDTKVHTEYMRDSWWCVKAASTHGDHAYLPATRVTQYTTWHAPIQSCM